tara:strand:+ start:96 stop:341 length:246 start_codon:yes stop_codon:yes gene_type:complete
MAQSPWSDDAFRRGDNNQPAPFKPEHADTREKAIAELQLIAKVADPAVARSDSAQVIDELLRAIGYADVADAWTTANRQWD